MGALFWIRRFVVVAVLAFALLSGVQWLKGHHLDQALWHGGLWGLITATVFTGVAYYRYRKNRQCPVVQQMIAGQGPDQPA